MHIRLVAVLCFLSVGVCAQVSQVRFEIPLKTHQTEPYHIVSLHNEGLLLYSLIYGTERNAIELIRLDTSFKESWKGFIPVERNIVISAAKEFEGKTYFLLKDKFNPMSQFLILSVASKTGDYISRKVETQLPFNTSHFLVTKEAVVIGGYFNGRPLVLYYNFNNNKSRILPGFFNDVGELDHVHTDADGNIDIVVRIEDKLFPHSEAKVLKGEVTCTQSC